MIWEGNTLGSTLILHGNWSIGHSFTSTHNDLMNSNNDTKLSSSETEFDLTESTYTRNNIYESVENVIKQNDFDKRFDDSGYLAPMSKNVV